MEKTSTNWAQMSDKAIVAQIGNYVRQKRIRQNWTQTQVAERSGLNRWTISQIEKGEPITLMSLIRILRILDSLHTLNEFEVFEEVSPLEYAKLKKKQQQRVRNKKYTSDKESSEW